MCEYNCPTGERAQNAASRGCAVLCGAMWCRAVRCCERTKVVLAVSRNRKTRKQKTSRSLARMNCTCFNRCSLLRVSSAWKLPHACVCGVRVHRRRGKHRRGDSSTKATHGHTVTNGHTQSHMVTLAAVTP